MITHTPTVRQTGGPPLRVRRDVVALRTDGGGWRTRGRGYPSEFTTARMVGYRFIHTDEKGVTAVAFWLRAVVWFAAHGVRCERVISDNGSCYRSGLAHRACAETGTTEKKTRPRRPQTNGKVERFHRALLEEWAYIRPRTSEDQCRAAYDAFIHFYNHHRSHAAVGWATPTPTLAAFRDNLPAEHI